MTGSDEEKTGSVSGAPVDSDRVEVIRDRFTSDNRFCRVDEQPEFAPERLVCLYDQRFYPPVVLEARLEIVWFENGDFSLHYHEEHESGGFDHRWDRHPSNHNDRDHIHPGPDAPTPGEDASHPLDWRNVLTLALSEIEDRQHAFWETVD